MGLTLQSAYKVIIQYRRPYASEWSTVINITLIYKATRNVNFIIDGIRLVINANWGEIRAFSESSLREIFNIEILDET